MLTLPYPNSPSNNDPLDATPIKANQTAIAQAIQSFDGSQIMPGTIAGAAFADAVNPVTRLKETTSNFISTGCTWSSVGGLVGTMSSGIVYINGLRVPINGINSYTFTASQDTYIDVDVNGNVYYIPVPNNATSGMTLTANAVRIAKVVSGTGSLTVYSTGVDPLGNPIHPISPVSLTTNIFGNTVQSYTNTGSAGGTFYYINLAGIKLLWGTTGSLSVSGGSPFAIGYTLNFPPNFFNSIQSATGTVSGQATNTQFLYIAPNLTPTTSTWNFQLAQSSGSNGSATGASLFVIGN